MNMSNKKKIIISIIISAIVLAGVFVGIKVFSNSQEEIKIKDDVFADVSATWYRDFTYTTDASAKTITLTKYNKTAANVVIPNSATISGTKYTTIISNGLFRDNTSINSVEFESGVKADTTLARLFDGCTSLESVNFNNLNTSKVTNMSYMFRNTKISDLDISSFSTTKAENMVGMFDAMPLKRIKFGNFDFKITNIKSYPFGRGTWIREEDGKEYAAVDLVRDSSTKNISGTYKKVRNIIDEMSVPGSVTYRFDRVESIENFTTSNSEEIGFLDNQHIYLKNLPSSNIKDYKVTGSASVIAKNCIRDVNNNQYHLKITVDNIHVYDLVETDSSKIYGRLMGIERTSIALQNYFYSNLDDFRNMTNRILAKTSYAFDVTLEILNQNNEPVNGNYLFSIYDLDTPSPRDADTGLPSHVDGEGYGDYSEGITLQEGYDFSTIIPISIKNNKNIDDVFTEIEKNLNAGVKYYDTDEYTDQSLKDIIAEIIREKALKLLRDEVPHGIYVEVTKLKTRKTIKNEKIFDINATIYCLRNSHKGIILGKGGSMLKKIGTYSREDIEKMLDSKVNLQLWVKVNEDWINNDKYLKKFKNNE